MVRYFILFLLTIFLFSSCISLNEKNSLKQSVDESEFWLIIDQVRAVRSLKEREVIMKSILSNYTNKAVSDFIRIKFDKERLLHTWLIYSAAWMIYGNMTSLEFRFFRDKLIFLGKEKFETILISPDYLALYNIGKFDPSHLKKLSNVPIKIFEQRGGNINLVKETISYNIRGRKLTINESKLVLPQIYKKFDKKVK